jgi:hypothetical protein
MKKVKTINSTNLISCKDNFTEKRNVTNARKDLDDKPNMILLLQNHINGSKHIAKISCQNQ